MKDTWQLPLKPRLRRWRELRKEIVGFSERKKQLIVVNVPVYKHSRGLGALCL